MSSESVESEESGRVVETSPKESQSTDSGDTHRKFIGLMLMRVASVRVEEAKELAALAARWL